MFGPSIWGFNSLVQSLLGKVVSHGLIAALSSTAVGTNMVAGFYEVLAYISIPGGLSATGAVTLTVSWTDQNGTQSYTTASLSFVSRNALQVSIPIMVASATSVNINTTFVTVVGTVSYDVDAVIRKIS